MKKDMKKNRYTIRIFKCTECGNHLYAAKKLGNRTSIGHVKTMYCPFCDMDTQFIQIDTI